MEPAATDEALAVNVTVGAALVLTLIVTVFDVFPPGPFAVAVYVTFALTVTACDPDNGSDPELTVGDIVTEVAFLAVHVSVTDCPAVTLVELAEKVSEGAGLDPESLEVPPPLPPQEVNKIAKLARIIDTRRRRTLDTVTPRNRAADTSWFDSAALLQSCSR